LINALSLSQGGGRSFVINLLRELRRDDRGFDFTLLTLAGSLTGIDASGVAVEEMRLPRWGSPVRTPLRVLYELVGLPLHARRFDLLFCVADICPPLCPVPVVVLMRNLNIYDRRWFDDARTRTLFRLARLGAPRARVAVFPTQAAADAIRASVPVDPARVAVVPYGVSALSFEDAPPAGAAAPYLFLAAAPEPHKNIGVLIECLRFVSDPRLEVWIAGDSLLDPAHSGKLASAARELGVAERVRFLGPVPYARLLSLYRGAMALVFPSFIESFGHPLLEAMLAGTPAVVSDIPSFREIAGDAALYFPPADARALAARIDELRAKPEEARQRVEAACARAAGFTWQRSVDGLCRVFERALA